MEQTTEYTEHTEQQETDEHRAQLMNYLRATGIQVGLLINFSHYPGVEHERFVV